MVDKKMFEFDLKISEHHFTNTYRYEDSPESKENTLDLLLQVLPVYYSYKFKDNEQIKKLFSNIACLSIIARDKVSDLKKINNLNDNKCLYFNDNTKNNRLVEFIELCFNELIETKNFDCELFLEHTKKLNLSSFNEKRRLYNYINEIIGACYNLKNKIKKTKTFEKYITDKLFSILRLIDNEKYQLVKKYQRRSKKDNIYYLSCLYSKDKSNLEDFIESLKVDINKDIELLSITPNLDSEYISAIQKIKTQCISELPKYMELDRCFAIATNDKNIYFSFSGCWDIKGQISQEIQAVANEVNQNLFNGTGVWCNITDKVYDYIENGSPENENECIYRNTPEPFSGKNPRPYSCCERKIMGEQAALKEYDLYVMYSPCYKCAKPLYKNYRELICLLYYDEVYEQKHMKYKNDLFIPQQYKIIFDNNHYKTRVKKDKE